MISDYNGLPTTGEYKVAEVSTIWTDASRTETFETDGSNREVPVHFWYPEDGKGGEKYPLVIFSHGAFGFYKSNFSTYEELASHGYVVCSLDHPYHSFFTRDTDGKLITVNQDFLNSVMYINEKDTPEEEIFETVSGWMKIRTGDMNFVLDTIEGKCQEAVGNTEVNVDQADDSKNLDRATKDELEKMFLQIDCDKIGVMGHSLGGATAVAMGRERDDIDAVIDLDGSMFSEQKEFKDGKYSFYDEPYPVPLLAIDNEEHHTQAEELGALYVNHEVVKNAVDGRETYFKGAGHMNFTDLPLCSEPLAAYLGTGSIDKTKCIEETNAIVLQYFDHYLKGKPELTIKKFYE